MRAVGHYQPHSPYQIKILPASVSHTTLIRVKNTINRMFSLLRHSVVLECKHSFNKRKFVQNRNTCCICLYRLYQNAKTITAKKPFVGFIIDIHLLWLIFLSFELRNIRGLRGKQHMLCMCLWMNRCVRVWVVLWVPCVISSQRLTLGTDSFQDR